MDTKPAPVIYRNRSISRAFSIGCFAFSGTTLLMVNFLMAQPTFPTAPELTPQPENMQIIPPVANNQDEMEANDDFETLNRGQLHEAFATPSTNTPVEAVTVDKQPPEPVNELIPEEKPDGESMVWIQGYWSYDDDLKEYIWITGIWRDIPPGMRWVPGYWEEVDARTWRWVSGVWLPVQTAEVDYLPAPPESLEIGPSSLAPADNYCWIPGSWTYVNTSYAWSPGFWSPVNTDWMWVSSRYVYCRRGYIYCPGYWDYTPYRRGLVFAPIRWFRPVRINVVPFRPRFVVNTWRNFYSTLFVQRRLGYYAYGNYFGPQFNNRGFVHLSAFTGSKRGFYDPFYNYNRARFGNTFSTQLTGWNEYFVNNPNHRPGITLRDEIRLRNQQPERNNIMPFQVSNNLREVIRKNEAPIQLSKLNNDQLNNLRKVNKDMHEIAHERKQFESRNFILGDKGNDDLRNRFKPDLKPDVNNKLPDLKDRINKPDINKPDNKNGDSGKNNPGGRFKNDDKNSDPQANIAGTRNKLNLGGDKGLIREQIEQKVILNQEHNNQRNRIRDNTPGNNKNDNSKVDTIRTIPGNNPGTPRIKTGLPETPDRFTFKNKRDTNNPPNNDNQGAGNNNNPGRTFTPGNRNTDNKINDNQGNGNNNNNRRVDPGNNKPGNNNPGKINTPNIVKPNDNTGNSGTPTPGEIRRIEKNNPPANSGNTGNSGKTTTIENRRTERITPQGNTGNSGSSGGSTREPRVRGNSGSSGGSGRGGSNKKDK